MLALSLYSVFIANALFCSCCLPLQKIISSLARSELSHGRRAFGYTIEIRPGLSPSHAKFVPLQNINGRLFINEMITEFGVWLSDETMSIFSRGESGKNFTSIICREKNCMELMMFFSRPADQVYEKAFLDMVVDTISHILPME